MNVAEWSQLGIGTVVVLVVGYLVGKFLDKWNNKATIEEKQKLIEEFKTVVNNNTEALKQMNAFLQLEMTKQTEQLKQIVTDTDKIETIRIKVGEILDYVKPGK